jgi:hypothetical protein
MGSRMIEEDVMISGPSAQARILFVTPEVVFMPKRSWQDNNESVWQ